MTYSIYVMRDTAGVVLYVGVTTDLARRLREHENKPWLSLVQSTTVEQSAETKAEGFRLEREVIAEHQPVHNVAGTPLIGERHRAAHERRWARQTERHAAGALCGEFQCTACSPRRVIPRTRAERRRMLAEAVA